MESWRDDEMVDEFADQGEASGERTEGPVQPMFGAFARANTKEKLHTFLQARPAGADAHELMGLLFKGTGSDPELGSRLIERVLGDDPNFLFDPKTLLWSLSRSASLRVPLEEGRFVVVDLETTGGRAAAGSIIEIGAYRMTGRRICESFQSLVRPRMPIPRFIMGLTSITDQMVAAAPPIEEVLPEFRAFLGDAVLVAHNAAFDRSFLDFEFRRVFGLGLTNPILCTVRMARRFVPSLKRRRLDLLAEHFGLSTEGRHRGLGDARMAAELLSIFLEIATQMGLNRLDRLIDDHHRGLAGRRIERHVPPEVIAAMPQVPGVYLMRNERGDLLYVGKAARLRGRVNSYFNGGINLNAKTADLVSHVWSIETRVTRSVLEAGLVEAQLIRELKPPYNRMLKSAAPAYFLKIDLMDPFPRLKVSQKLTNRTGVMQIGPFIGRRNLDHAVRALSRQMGLRVCSGRIEPHEDFSPCIYGQMGHCASPCNLGVSEDRYGEQVRRTISFLRGRSGPLLGELARARDQASSSMRFEEAKRFHRELEAVTTLADRTNRISRVVKENNLVIVVRPTDPMGTAVAYVVLSGRLALTRELDAVSAAEEIAAFVAENFQRFALRPVARGDLEAMTIVARWLRERASDDGRLIYLNRPQLEPSAIVAAAGLKEDPSPGPLPIGEGAGKESLNL